MHQQNPISAARIVTESNGCAVFFVQLCGLVMCILFFPLGLLFGIPLIAVSFLFSRPRYKCGMCGTQTIRRAQICGACKSPLYLKPVSPVVVILILSALAVLAGAIAAMYSKV